MKRSSWIIWVGPKSNDQQEKGRRRFQTGRQKRRPRGGSSVTIEAEIRVVQPQAKEC
jgi:hypothetical protein